MPAATPNFLANGSINPSVFVKPDATKNFMVLQAGAGDVVIGVSQEGTRQPPGVTGSDGFAAHQNEQIQVFGEGYECLLTLGGTVAAGDYLVSDANGHGITLVPVTGTTFHYGAVALEGGVSGEKRRVLVTLGEFKSA